MGDAAAAQACPAVDEVESSLGDLFSHAAEDDLDEPLATRAERLRGALRGLGGAFWAEARLLAPTARPNSTDTSSSGGQVLATAASILGALARAPVRRGATGGGASLRSPGPPTPAATLLRSPALSRRSFVAYLLCVAVTLGATGAVFTNAATGAALWGPDARAYLFLSVDVVAATGIAPSSTAAASFQPPRVFATVSFSNVSPKVFNTSLSNASFSPSWPVRRACMLANRWRSVQILHFFPLFSLTPHLCSPSRAPVLPDGRRAAPVGRGVARHRPPAPLRRCRRNALVASARRLARTRAGAAVRRVRCASRRRRRARAVAAAGRNRGISCGGGVRLFQQKRGG